MTYHLVFDTTDPKSPRFIELEDSTGHSISAGEWKQRKDGYVELVLPAPAGDGEEYNAGIALRMAERHADLQELYNSLVERCAVIAETPDAWRKSSGDFEGNCIAAAIRDVLLPISESRYRASEPVWQDIATVPCVGKKRLLFITKNYGIVTGHGVSGTKRCVPTHCAHSVEAIGWMPLPALPSPPKPLSYEGEQS